MELTRTNSEFMTATATDVFRNALVFLLLHEIAHIVNRDTKVVGEAETPLQLSGRAKVSTVNALAFQRAGPLLASGGGDGKLVLWQPDCGKRALADTRFGAGVTQIVWSGDDNRLAVGTEAGEVAVFGG